MFEIISVFYKPSSDDIRYFNELSKIVKVTIVNNSFLEDLSENIEWIGNQENKGLSVALNLLLNHKINKKLLYIDQDSRISLSDVCMLNEQLHINNNSIFCLNVESDKGSFNLHYNAYFRFSWHINSGILFNANDLLQIGGFNEKYFIDRIDFELFYRLNREKFEIIELPTTLYQVFGSGTKKNRYPNIRLYYMGRSLKQFCLVDYNNKILGSIYLMINSVKNVVHMMFYYNISNIKYYLKGIFK